MANCGDSDVKFSSDTCILLRRFNKLLNLDVKISAVIHVLFEAFKQQRVLPNLVEEGKTLSDYTNYSIVGSCAEGTAGAGLLSSFFPDQGKTATGNGAAKVNQPWAVNKCIHGAEVDIIVDLAKMDETEFCQFVEPTADTFYTLKNQPNVWRLIQKEKKLSDEIMKSMNRLRTKTCLSGKDFKDFLKRMIVFDHVSDIIKHPPKGDAYSVQDYSIGAAAAAAGYGRIRRTLFSFLFIYWLTDSFQTFTL